ncbi:MULTISPECIES: hypothetical protein [unclassified Xanthomonas]|uniref:hypothetical protein n=1 Tax=unclassified Xanthomonas TaxID=2643310 RepID=UPI002A82E8B8|nr:MULTISPECIES: hypothetical protein [unclassified Xanthomonas]MDY4297546.1 hypothetical protein [Xanthomonas sp. LF02-5]MDY4359340.1 hypothetical protein [Xanthomonas sp. LF04-12]
MATDSVPQKHAFSMTVRQCDELQAKMKLMRAVCDAFTTGTADDMQPDSVTTLAMLGFEAGVQAEKLLKAIGEQRLGVVA